MNHQADIVVVGAGMVGAALATGLGQSGYQVVLVDPSRPEVFEPGADPDIRVSALSSGSERYLDSLGAWSHVRSMRLTPYRRLSVWDDTPTPFARLIPPQAARTTFDATELAIEHLGHIVENRVTQRALWLTASGDSRVETRAGQRVTALHEDHAGIRVTLDNGDLIEARLVVGADGAQSAIRGLAGIGTRRDEYAQQALVASVQYRGEPQDMTWQAFYPSGPRAFLPLHGAGEGLSWASLVWYDQPQVLAGLKQLSDEELASRIQTAFPDTLPEIVRVAARASFPIARQHASAYFRGRVALVGDAAHTINPLAGQGVNLGFQDAECLQTLLGEARRRHQDPASAVLLARYEQQRRPANRRMMLAMDGFYYLFSNRQPPLHLVRNAGLAMARNLPFARKQVARYALGLQPSLPAPLQRALSAIPRPGA